MEMYGLAKAHSNVGWKEIIFGFIFISLVDEIGNYEDVLKKEFPYAKIVEMETKKEKIMRVIGGINFNGVFSMENIIMKNIRRFL